MSYSASSQAAWPIPTPAAIYNQAATIYETNPALAGIDARSANTLASTHCRLWSLGSYDRYLMQANLAQELMPDTAVVWLIRHANIWNVPQLQPTPATGNAIFSGQAGINIPAGTMLTAPAGWLFMTTAAGTIGGGGTVSIPVTSVLGGIAYNLPAGTILQLVSAIESLGVQAATLDSNGAGGGTDLETIPAWRIRILAAIRNPAEAGTVTDYARWALTAGAACVSVVPQAVGAGSVGIYIADVGPTVAGAPLIADVQNYIGVYNGSPNGGRPVTARAVVGALTLIPVNVTLALNPNTATTEEAATQALQLFFQQLAASVTAQALSGGSGGVTCYVSRLDNAVSNGDGEYSHERILPAADVTCTGGQLLVLGTVNFE